MSTNDQACEQTLALYPSTTCLVRSALRVACQAGRIGSLTALFKQYVRFFERDVLALQLMMPNGQEDASLAE